MRHYSIEEIKASYAQKRDWEKQFPVSRYIFRPVSFAVAALLSRVTNSPEALAWFGLAVGLLSSWLLLKLGAYGPWPGVAGLAAFALLDAVDGNMARVTGRVTLYGKMLDSVLGRTAEGLYLPALACGLALAGREPCAARAGGPGWLLVAAGFWALCASLYSGILETTYDYFKLQKAPAGPADVTAVIGSSRFRGNPLYAVFINLNAFNVQVLLLAAAAAFGAEPLFVWAIAAYYTLRLLVTFPYYMRRASVELK